MASSPHVKFSSPMDKSSCSADQINKIFIGGLNSSTTDEQLERYCAKFGVVTRCFIVRDKTERSRGFAFVGFEEHSSVDEFMKNRPHTIDRRKIEVRRAMPREQALKFNGHLIVNKIFVGAIQIDLTEDDLKSYFQNFGNIIECHIMKDKEEKSRGFAFITFDDYDAVDRCILQRPHVLHGKEVDVQKAIPKDQLNHMRDRRFSNMLSPECSIPSTPTLFSSYPQATTFSSYVNFPEPITLTNGNEMAVGPQPFFINPPAFYPYQLYSPPLEYVSPRVTSNQFQYDRHRTRHFYSSGSGSLNSENNRKLFIGGLSSKTTDETLKDYVMKFGEVIDCLVMKDVNGHSKCFGFVTFVDCQSVDEFMKHRPHKIDGRQVDPKRAMPREEALNDDIHLKVRKVFLGGIRDGLDEETLRTYFEPYGNVVECLLMHDNQGKMRGFAFIEFDDYDAVDKVILARPHIIGEQRVDVKKAVPKVNRSYSQSIPINPFPMHSTPAHFYSYNPIFAPTFYSPPTPFISPYGSTTPLDETLSDLQLTDSSQQILTSNIQRQTSEVSQQS